MDEMKALYDEVRVATRRRYDAAQVMLVCAIEGEYFDPPVILIEYLDPAVDQCAVILSTREEWEMRKRIDAEGDDEEEED